MPVATDEIDARSLPLPQLLSRIQIASPCEARWEDMAGNDRRRFCAQCDLFVHNLEAMTESQVRDLLTSADGRICGRIRRRVDGTILMRDCPVGLARVRRMMVQSALRVVAMAVFTVASMLWIIRIAVSMNDDAKRAEQRELWPRTKAWLGVEEPPVFPPIMGDIAMPMPLPNTAGTAPAASLMTTRDG